MCFFFQEPLVIIAFLDESYNTRNFPISSVGFDCLLTSKIQNYFHYVILISSETFFSIFMQVFQRVAPSAKLKTFKDSIRLFMHHFLAKGLSKESENSEQKQLLKKRLKTVDGILTSSIFED